MLVPGAADLRRALRPHRVAATRSRCRGPDVAPAFSGLPGRRPRRVGRVPRRVRPHPPSDVGGLQRLGGRSRVLRRCPTCEFMPRVRRGQPLRLPARRPTTPTVRPLDATWHRIDSSVRETDEHVRAAGARSPTVPRAARWSTSRSARSAAPTSTCMQRLVDVLAHDPAPLHREQGPAAPTEIELADNMVGRGVPAADARSSRRSTSSSPTAATTRPPRRCTSASRWCCCRSSGTSTTTPSGCTSSASDAGSRPTASPTTSCSARSTGCSATPTCATASAASARRSGPVTGCAEAPDVIEQVGLDHRAGRRRPLLACRAPRRVAGRRFAAPRPVGAYRTAPCSTARRCAGGAGPPGSPDGVPPSSARGRRVGRPDQRVVVVGEARWSSGHRPQGTHPAPERLLPLVAAGFPRHPLGAGRVGDTAGPWSPWSP